VKHRVDGRDGWVLGNRSELGSSNPGGWGQFSDAADGQLGEAWQDRREIIADGDFQPTAGFDDNFNYPDGGTMPRDRVVAAFGLLVSQIAPRIIQQLAEHSEIK
jgi:hypothetical protein